MKILIGWSMSFANKMFEVHIAKQRNKPVKYFQIQKSKTIIAIEKDQVEMEDEVKEFRSAL